MKCAAPNFQPIKRYQILTPGFYTQNGSFGNVIASVSQRSNPLKTMDEF
jgi:hypothetical protein